jgi:uncharacterized protein
MAKATKRATKRPAAKAATKKRAPARAAKRAPRKASRAAAKRMPAARKAPAAKKRARAKSAPAAKPDVLGWITHTELATNNPSATLAWGTKVFGWKARDSMPTPNGPYYMFAYSGMGGGGIRGLDPTEKPSSMPYVSVKDCHAAYEKALASGAEGVQAPQTIVPGVTIATVRAPGGILIGLSGP